MPDDNKAAKDTLSFSCSGTAMQCKQQHQLQKAASTAPSHNVLVVHSLYLQATLKLQNSLQCLQLMCNHHRRRHSFVISVVAPSTQSANRSSPPIEIPQSSSVSPVKHSPQLPYGLRFTCSCSSLASNFCELPSFSRPFTRSSVYKTDSSPPPAAASAESNKTGSVSCCVAQSQRGNESESKRRVDDDDHAKNLKLQENQPN